MDPVNATLNLFSLAVCEKIYWTYNSSCFYKLVLSSLIPNLVVCLTPAGLILCQMSFQSYQSYSNNLTRLLNLIKSPLPTAVVPKLFRCADH